MWLEMDTNLTLWLLQSEQQTPIATKTTLYSIVVLYMRQEECDLCNYDPYQELLTYVWYDKKGLWTI
jgi:hypothetical protein